MGIQGIREIFEDLKNKGKISASVYLDYQALYKQWLSHKGNKEAKADDLKKLKSLYAEHIYEK